MNKLLLFILLATVIIVASILMFSPDKASVRQSIANHLPSKESMYSGAKAPYSKVINTARSSLPRDFTVKIISVLTARSALVFFSGTLIFLLVIRIIVAREKLSFISTLEHELTHGLVAILSGGNFNEMKVTAGKGGCAQVTNANFFVHIAPYCLPLFCMASLALVPFMQQQAKIAAIVFAGISYGSYLLGNFPNISRQPDIRNSGGKMIAFPVIGGFNLLLLTGILMFLSRYKL